MKQKWIGAAAALSGLLAVALGAFGAHALKAHLNPEMLAIFHTGVEYQFYHAFALLGCASLSIETRWAPRLFLAGIFLFSGSLYVLAITGVRELGMITPLGGLSWLVAWGLLTQDLLKSSRRKRT